jgi:hypothetical protein
MESKMTKGILWGYFPNLVKVSRRYPYGCPHHVTLKRGIFLEEHCDFIGKRFSAIATQLCWNDRIEAIAVKLPEWVPCTIEYPHITVSWVAGAKPVESNTMLATKYSYLNLDEKIDVVIDFLAWE